LFHGRDDPYARRFESLITGQTGYQPACGNEWVRGLCIKQTGGKCARCARRRLLPITHEVIHAHFAGYDAQGKPFVVGLYPMLADETCFLLAVDFDKAGWQEDATAYYTTCRRLALPLALERSRSGKGSHIWFFFTSAIPATLARKLAAN